MANPPTNRAVNIFVVAGQSLSLNSSVHSLAKMKRTTFDAAVWKDGAECLDGSYLEVDQESLVRANFAVFRYQRVHIERQTVRRTFPSTCSTTVRMPEPSPLHAEIRDGTWVAGVRRHLERSVDDNELRLVGYAQQGRINR